MHPTQIVKTPVILLLAVTVNVLLFLLIHQMVTNEIGKLPDVSEVNLIDFIQVEPETETDQQKKMEEETPDEPPPQETPPEVPKMEQPDVKKPDQPNLDLPTPNIDVPLGVGGTPYLGDYLKSAPPKQKIDPGTPSVATNLTPTTRIEPSYPPRALRAGVEGTVTVEFTITTDGSVKDIEIIEANPKDIFDRAVVNAVKRWKFSPQMVDGKATERRARQEIKFTLQ